MRRPPSLTLRLTLFFGVIAIVVFTGFGWFIERSIDRHFIMEDEAELGAINHSVTQLLDEHGGIGSLATLRQRLDDILVGHHGAVLYIAAPGDGVLYASHGRPDLSAISPADAAAGRAAHSFRWDDDRHAYRVQTRYLTAPTAGAGGRYTLSIAVGIDHHLRFLTGFRHTLWMMIATAIAVMSMMGWVAVRQGHGPLHDIVAQIRETSAAELHTRLPPESVPRELGDLAVAFNEMLARMEDAFQRLSNFSADIAHELRTPVTNLLTQTQVALSKSRSEDEYREILYSNMEEYERMAQMIGDMLFIAKTENGLYHLDTADIDLGNEVQRLFDYYEAWAEEGGITLSRAGDASVTGDRLMLKRALGNLLSNAIRHTPAGNTVMVRLAQQANRSVSVSVENPGPTIPAEHIPRLFDRFYRVDASRKRGIDGAGLGLAIAKSIIDIHGGTISASSGDGRTCFRILLPPSPPTGT